MAARKPKVLNRKTDDCVKAVFVGRPSKWGNPFVIGKDGNREEVIEKFRRWFMKQPKLVAMAKKELRGRDLACFCAPMACHGDILLEVANER